MKEELTAGAWGVEARYPFLDPDVVQEYLWLTPALKNSEYKRPVAEMLRSHHFPNAWGVKKGFTADHPKSLRPTATALSSEGRSSFLRLTHHPSPPSTLLPVHVVLAADAAHLPGVCAVMRSAVNSSSSPWRLEFHLVVTRKEEGLASRMADCCLPPDLTSQRVQLHRLPNISAPIRIRRAASPHLDTPLNFARFYLDRTLPPRVGKLLYLDADTLVTADICQLFDSTFSHLSTHMLAAVPREKRLSAYVRFPHPALSSTGLRGDMKTFNAGVLVLNLTAWRASNATASLERWMRINVREHLYDHGSQPPLLLSFVNSPTQALAQASPEEGRIKQPFRGVCTPLDVLPVALVAIV
ncbi:MAG: hypothetical protein SGPRY_011579 [Prymnesium sp.]